MSSTDEPNSDNYTTVRLPNELILEMDDIIRRRVRGYKSRAEFIKEAIRRHLDDVQATSKQT
jgi:metal-responsive CopG/Arc/MetJ family transcriptional regulator